ncbi:MAG: hypothetical protein LUE24_03920 [Lachnospiraceae bacterium]|nr:hypothetical protein [Lachnospiraceae bacterium]
MCKALDDMRQEAMEQGIEQGISRGIEQGIERGEVKGEDRFARLTNLLLSDGRMDDLHHAIANLTARRELYQEYQIR